MKNPNKDFGDLIKQSEEIQDGPGSAAVGPAVAELVNLTEAPPHIQKMLEAVDVQGKSKKEALASIHDVVVKELEKNPETNNELLAFKVKIRSMLRKEMGYTPEQEKLEDEREAFEKRMADQATKLGVSTESFVEEYAREEDAAREENPEDPTGLYETAAGSKTVERSIGRTVTEKIKGKAEKIKGETDALTGIANRRGLAQDVERRQKEVKEKGEFSMIMIDIDHFKKVNDTYGHEAGDYVLREVAKILSSNMRQGDTIARFGGEELIVMAPNANGDAPKFAERLRRTMENSKIVFNGQEIPITISLGVSPYEKDFEKMKQRSDTGLYLAKGAKTKLEDGIEAEQDPEGSPTRNQVRYFDAKDGKYKKVVPVK
jgi:diguanylate cyclase (GGDEF)-like protein